MTGKRTVAHAHLGNLRKSGLECREELGFQHAVNSVSRICVCDIARNILIEKKRVYYLI